jgi:hypothetical protein
MSTSAFPATLILEAGDYIQGRYVRLERGTTREGVERPIVVLVITHVFAGEHDVDEAERSLWLHETALRSQFHKCAPEEGETVRITKGAEQAVSESTGRRYWPFSVTAPDRPVESVGWDDAMFAGGGDDEDAS